MIVHQSNHSRIQELRRTTESLDQTLRKTIQLLADTRKDILSIPSSSTSEEPRRKVEVDELLAYAKFISKTTVPSTFSKRDAHSLPVKSEETNAQITNGIATPPMAAQEDAHMENTGVKAEDTKAKQLGNSAEASQFVAWPSQEVIQRGALADVQRMIDAGRDPAAMLTAEEQAEVDRIHQEEEQRAKALQEEAERRRMSMFDTSAIRRSTMADVFDPDNL